MVIFQYRMSSDDCSYFTPPTTVAASTTTTYGRTTLHDTCELHKIYTTFHIKKNVTRKVGNLLIRLFLRETYNWCKQIILNLLWHFQFWGIWSFEMITVRFQSFQIYIIQLKLFWKPLYTEILWWKSSWTGNQQSSKRLKMR